MTSCWGPVYVTDGSWAIQLIVVEHDEDTMLAADHIVDIGPGAGEHGGQVIATGYGTES